MKKIYSSSMRIALGVSFVLSLMLPMTAMAATTPALGATATYGVLSDTYTNTVAGTTINGDVGFTTPPAMVPGGVHTNYGPGAPYPTAVIDQGVLTAALAVQPCTFTFAPGAIDLSTDITHGPAGIFTPGVYCSVGAMSVSGPLTLNGSGTFIFRAVGALNTTAGSIVTLAGASVCDVFWTPTAATTLGANSTFFGTVIDAAGVTTGANTTWSGRALAAGGTVTTDTTTLSVPTCLNVTKQVINDDGGIAAAVDFSLHVLSGGVDVAGSPAVGVATPGRSYTLPVGPYQMTEDANAGYLPFFSGDCDATGNLTLTLGANANCILTNDDIAPTLTVVKVVINDNGGTNVVADFPLFVDGVAVVSGITNVTAVGAHTVTETANVNYTQSFSGDCNINGNVTLASGDIKVCVITNDDIAPVVTPPGGGGGGGGGFTPTPVVLPVPPLIDVLKVPDPLALPAGPGMVNYTYTLRNIGTVPVTDVTMVGDTCVPIVLAEGDTNNDARLDVSETWRYTCTTMLMETHTNTIVATAWANGLSATDIASATVIVGMPVVPPLIHVVKIPNPMLLPAAGGLVTYTEIVTNPGTVPLTNVRLTDDKCRPLRRISGDKNFDNKLDTNEKWIYTCRSLLTQTTTNTATAVGEANGITVRDFAIVTVVVAINIPDLFSPVPTSVPVAVPTVPAPVPVPVPKLPKTGFPTVSSTPAIATPLRLTISSIAVDAAIEKVGLTKNGTMDVPKSHLGLGWYGLGAKPGEIGSAVVAGHLNWLYDAKGVFINLNKVKPGDKISVYDEKGTVVTFVVRESKIFSANADATEVFQSTDGKAHLNLITCAGVWNNRTKQYTKRLVVFADKV